MGLKKSNLKYLLLILIFFSAIHENNAQLNLQFYIDIGENNVSGGTFVNNLYRGSYQFKNYNIEGGLQLDIKSENSNTLTGIDIIGLRKFSIKKIPVDVKGFFMLNRFSDILYETNYGVRIETRILKSILFEIGTNFKSYKINATARKKYDIDKSNSTLNENLIYTYLLSAYLKPHNNNWNVGLSVTNYDYYIINQLINPNFNLLMKYKLGSNLTLYLDSWYKLSGIFNIHANHFGYFFRSGLKWKI